MKDKEYTGILAEPIPKWTALSRPSDEEYDKLLKAKISALFEHYSLDENDISNWASLALNLAQRHVPGFKLPARRQGRPAERTSDDLTLFLHIELFKRRDKLSEREATERIAVNRIVSGTFNTIRTRYNNCKKRFYPITTLMDNFSAAMGDKAIIGSLEDALLGYENNIISSPP